MLISSAAYFDVCGCGRHGRIVTATGESSVVFCSKEVAHATLNAAIKEGRIAADEQLIVSSQIDGSLLAEEEYDANIDARIKAEIINAVHEIWLERAGELPQPEYVN